MGGGVIVSCRGDATDIRQQGQAVRERMPVHSGPVHSGPVLHSLLS